MSRLVPCGDHLHRDARFCGDLRLSDLRRDDRRRRAPASHVFLPELFARQPFYRRRRVYPVTFFLPPCSSLSFRLESLGLPGCLRENPRELERSLESAVRQAIKDPWPDAGGPKPAQNSSPQINTRACELPAI